MSFRYSPNEQTACSKFPEFIDWPNNVWMGVSVENCDYTWRIDCLRTTNAFIKFLSIEPLLGPIDNLELNQIDWVIVGGESGTTQPYHERGMGYQYPRSVLRC